MGIIRFSDSEVFHVDSSEYDILANAVKKIKGVPGSVVEIGTRRGGSAKLIIDTLVSNNDTNRFMLCIDPYGNIGYPCTNISVTTHNVNAKIEGDPLSKDITNSVRLDYTNDMRNRTIPSLYYYAYQAGLNFTFFCLEDSEFFLRYADGVPVYDQYKTIENQYALVFFDGPHDNASVHLETDFFMERTAKGAVLVYDDIWMYDHDAIEKKLFERGFETVEKKTIKASYVRKV